MNFLGLFAVSMFVTITLTMIRNNQVYKFRASLLDEESKFTQNRVNEGKGFDALRRHDALPHYYKMVFEFWKHLTNTKGH